jgi:hypothetical protein
MKLLSTHVEAEALEYARGHLALFRDDGWFDKDDTRYFAVQALKTVALAGHEQMMTVVSYARQGWDLAHKALEELILDFEGAGLGQQRPIPLVNYNMEIVGGFIPKRVPGAKKVDNIFRDIVIALTVFRVAKRFGFKYTRDRYAPRPCACSIVAQAIPMLTEEGVKAIWKKHGVPHKAFLHTIVAAKN